MTAPECHPDRRHAGRGMCSTCYSRAWRTGTLDQHQVRDPTNARRGRPVTCLAVLEDVLWVWDCTCRCHKTTRIVEVHGVGRTCHCGGLAPIAARLGITRAALQKALSRARARRELTA